MLREEDCQVEDLRACHDWGADLEQLETEHRQRRQTPRDDAFWSPLLLMGLRKVQSCEASLQRIADERFECRMASYHHSWGYS